MSRLLRFGDNKITKKYKTTNPNKHLGIDIVGKDSNGKSKTDWILAHSDGTVVGIEKNYNKTDKTGHSYGNYVKIKHDNGYYTMYGHLKFGTVICNKGTKIKKGEIIGYMGNTGHSTGAHLHFEVRNLKDSRIDPTPYLENDLPSTWVTGKYKLLESKTIRTSCTISVTNQVKVKQCMKSVKPKLTSTIPTDIAKFKKGVTVDITEIIIKDKRVWGKLKNSYIVLCNNDGTPQAKLV